MNKAREKLLLIRIQKLKDKESFTELYQELVDPLYRFVFFKVNDQELAQDITSDVFLKGWKELTKDDSKEIRHIKAFFYTVARNLVIDYYRSAARQREVQLEEHQEDSLPQVPSHKEEVHIKIETEYVLKLVTTLKSSYQEIIILRHVNELSIAEISKIIQKSPVATRVLLHRANKVLIREYEKASSDN